MIRFDCPSCQKRLKAPDDAGGRTTSCTRCGQRLYVPTTIVQHQAPPGNLVPILRPISAPPDYQADRAFVVPSRPRVPFLPIAVSLILGMFCLPIALASDSPLFGAVIAFPG